MQSVRILNTRLNYSELLVFFISSNLKCSNKELHCKIEISTVEIPAVKERPHSFHSNDAFYQDITLTLRKLMKALKFKS